MGSRHLIVVYSGGEYKVAQYCQWDGYPTGQGVDVLSFLNDSKRVEKLKSKLSLVRFIDFEKDKDFIETYNNNTPEFSSEPDKRTAEQKHWYFTYISRDLSADILFNIANSKDNEILLKNSIRFATDPTSCEWAYVIDFDAGTFKVYRGNQGWCPFGDAPFEDIEDKKDSTFYDLHIVKRYQLDNLPDKNAFLADFENSYEDKE